MFLLSNSAPSITLVTLVVYMNTILVPQSVGIMAMNFTCNIEYLQLIERGCINFAARISYFVALIVTFGNSCTRMRRKRVVSTKLHI